MKTIVSGLTTMLGAGTALAHPSVVSHDHPHDVSVLPDLTLMLVAALIVAGGSIAFRHFRKR